jgi:amiloride-sensitive sodium channel
MDSLHYFKKYFLEYPNIFMLFRRNCYLENEKTLKFFKVYTKNNCENECLSDFMLNRCGCVEFFMIRNSSTRICSVIDRNCFKKAEEDFQEQNDFCECLDPCEFVKYNFEINEYGTIE